jgi:hypothetical protein
MDMTKTLRKFLTDDRLHELGGVYVGVIADVLMMEVHNRFIGARVSEPPFASLTTRCLFRASGCVAT